MLHLASIAKTFHTGTANETFALQQVNLEIAQGEYVVLVGANGSGKSSLLNIIAGTYPPDAGKVVLDGEDITSLPDFKRSQWIARMFQNPLLGTVADLSILDNFRLASLRTQAKTLKIGNTTNFKQIVRKKVETLNMGLENRLDQPIGTLSGGQRQALTLLMAVMDKAKLLLMDEPTAALDPRSAANFMESAAQIIQQLGLTTLLITHDMRDALQYGTRLICMQEGKVGQDISHEKKKYLTLSAIQDWFLPTL